MEELRDYVNGSRGKTSREGNEPRDRGPSKDRPGGGDEAGMENLRKRRDFPGTWPEIRVDGRKVQVDREKTPKSPREAVEVRRRSPFDVFDGHCERSPEAFGRDSLRRRSTTSLIKKIKDKVQDKLKMTNDTEFKTYLAPEINIDEGEHRRALENFRIFTRHNRKLESGPNFKTSTHAIYEFVIDRYWDRKRSHRMGDFDYLASDPLDVFDGHLRLRVYLNETSRVGDVVRWRPSLTVGLCPTEKELSGLESRLRDLNLSYFYHRRTFAVNTRVVFVDEPPFGERRVREWVEWEYCRPTRVTHSLAERDVKDDRLVVRLVFEPLLPLIKFYVSNDGVLNWTIERFAEKRDAERSGDVPCQYSPYFYSHPRGYRMQVRLCLNGAGVARGTHLSVFLDFLVGEWDDDLPPLDRFPHRTTFILLESADGGPIVVSETSKDGHPTDFFYDFVHLSLVDQDPYPKDDALHVRVVVEPIDESPLL